MQAIIFDIDGTLLRSSNEDDQLYKQALESVLGEVRIRDSLHDYEHVSDSGILSEVFIDNGIDPEGRRFEAVRNAFFAGVRRYLDTHGPFPEVPGARRYLERIAASPEHKFAIATGGWRASAMMKLQAAKLHFDDCPLATADDAKDRKEIMLLALDALGDEFASVTYYGDGPWDQEASRLLGWNFVGVGPALGGIDSFHQELP